MKLKFCTFDHLIAWSCWYIAFPAIVPLALFLAFTVLLAACTPGNKSDLKEVGYIMDPPKWGANFSYNKLKMHSVKVCHLPIFKECSSGTVVSNEGHVLTAFHVVKMSGMKEKNIFSDETDIGHLALVSPFNEDSQGRPVEPLVFKATYLQSKSGDVDGALLRVDDIEYFSKFTFPVRMNLTIDLSKEYLSLENIDKPRLFLAGFPSPHHSLDQLQVAQDTARAKEDGIIVPDVKRHPGNYEFAVTTGLYGNIGSTTRVGTSVLHKDSVNVFKKDSKAFTAPLGTSGGGIYISNGDLVAYLTRSSLSSFYDNPREKNESTTTTTGISLIHAKGFLNLEDVFKEPSGEVSFDTSWNLLQDLLKSRADNLEKFLKKSIVALKGKKKKLEFEFKTNRQGLFGISGYDAGTRARCFFLNSGKPYSGHISAIQGRIIDHEKSSVRFRIDKSELPIVGNSWTKWLEVPTGHILANIVMDLGVTKKLGNVTLKGFGPFISDSNLIKKEAGRFRSIGKRNIIGVFASAVLSGRFFEVGGSITDKYTIYECIGQ